MGSPPGEDDVSPVLVDGDEIEMVQGFTYPGSKLSCDEEITLEVSCHITRDSKAFGCLSFSIVPSPLIPRELSIRLLMSLFC